MGRKKATASISTATSSVPNLLLRRPSSVPHNIVLQLHHVRHSTGTWRKFNWQLLQEITPPCQAIPVEVNDEEADIKNGCLTDVIVVPTKEYYTEKELDILNKIENFQFWPSESQLKKKVQKYKYVTSTDIAEEFIHVTYPAVRKELSGNSHGHHQKHQHQEYPTKLSHKPKCVEIKPTPTKSSPQTKSFLSKTLDLPADEVSRILVDTDPSLAKTPFDVQMGKSIHEGGPLHFAPSTFPAKLCEKCYTLAYFREMVFLESSSPLQRRVPKPIDDEVVNSLVHFATPNPDKHRGKEKGQSAGSSLPARPIDKLFDVTVFHPANFVGDIQSAVYAERKKVHLKISCKIQMLGSQTFMDLKEVFFCHSDCYDTIETERIPDKPIVTPQERLSKAVSPRWLILFDEKIIADLDNLESRKVAEAMKKYYVRLGKEMVISDAKQMQLLRMPIKVGEPYVYVHGESCQHIFEFQKSRFLGPEHCIVKSSYPRYIYKNNPPLKCRIDKKNLAEWSVNDFHLLPEISMLLCTRCVRSFCYDKHGKKRGDFKLYKFELAPGSS